MKKLFASLCLMLLVGCTINPVKVQLPEATEFMKSPCVTELKGIKENAKKADVLEATASNSESFYLCARKTEDWNKFYNELKTINDAAQ